MTEEQFDKTSYLIEEYKTLKHEIDQNNRDIFAVLEISLTVSITIATLSFTQAIVDDYRWLCLLLPCLILSSATLLITQRIKHTWIIGRYIQLHLEKHLGFGWERFNYDRKLGQRTKARLTRRRLTSFAGTTTNMLMFAQVIYIALSFTALLPRLLDENLLSSIKLIFVITWFLLSSLFLSSIAYQRKKVDEINDPHRLVSELLFEPENEQ